MTTIRTRMAAIITAALWATACAPDPVTFCGTGTRLEEEKCVPIPAATCPEGQARVDGACRVVCGTNTVDSGAGCVVAAGACGEGTKLKSGACVAIDPMERVQVQEAAEPNQEPAKAVTFELPAVGGTPVVLGGTIGPVVEGKGDFDSFVFQGTAGTMVKIAAQAVGAPNVAVRVYPTGVTGAETLSSYVFSSTSREPSREIFLPVTAEWVVEVSATDNFAEFGAALPVGAPEFTYTVDVSSVTAPSTSALTSGVAVQGSFETVGVYSVPGAANGISLYTLKLETPEAATALVGLRRLVVVDSANKLIAISTDTISAGTLKPMSPLRIVVPQGGAKVVVDYVFAPDAKAPFKLTGLAGDVDLVTIPAVDAMGTLADDGLQVFAFDAVPNNILKISFSRVTPSSIGKFHCELRDQDYKLVDEITSSFSTLDGFIGATTGRWLVICDDQQFDATKTDSFDFKMTVALTPVASLGTLTNPGTLDGQVTITTVGIDKGVYAAFTVASDGTVANIGATPTGSTAAQMKIGIILYDTNMKQLGILYSSDATLGQTSTLTAQTLSKGNYLLQIYGSSIYQPGDAIVQIDSVSASVIDEVEPNDSSATAQPLTLDPSKLLMINASWTGSDSYDYFKFSVAQTTRISIKTANRGDANIEDLTSRIRAVGSTTSLDSDYSYYSYDAVTELSATLEPNTDGTPKEYELQIVVDTSYQGSPGGYSIAIAILP